MALADMFGLLGGGSSSDPLDIYGDLFTEKQKAALQQRSAGEGLLRMAGSFGKAAQPSRMPTSFMGALGEAAGAMAGHGDQAAESALKAMEIGEKVRSAKQKREWTAKVLPMLMQAAQMEKQYNLPPGTLTSQVPGAGAAPGAPTAPGAGGGGPNAPPPPPLPGMTTSATAADAPVPAPQPPGAVPPPGRGWDDLFMGGSRTAPGTAPGGGDFPGATSMAPQQNTGLLPPQDQVVGPDGQPLQGPGILPNIMNASLTGGMPGGMPPFRRASSTPTGSATPGAAGGDEWLRQNAPFPVRGQPRPPGAYARGFTYDAPKVPFGQDPGDFLPGRQPSAGTADAGRQARVDFWVGQGAPRHVAEGIADRVRAESGFNPSAIGDKGTSGGLYQHHADRLARLKQFAAQQNRPWTDPNVQDQFAATEVKGGDRQATKGWQEILNAPDQQTAAKLWDRHFERSAAGPGARGGQDTVIPSGRGVPASALRTVADTGAAPGAPANSGIIPGLNMTPQQAGAMGAITEILGLDNPFKPILDTYYKSPGYLGEAATAETTARKKVEEEFAPRIKEAETLADLRAQQQLRPELERRIEEAKNDPKLDYEQKKAIIDRETKQLEQLQAGMLSSREVVVTPPGGQSRKMTLTNEQILRLNTGKGLPELGLPPMTGMQLGEPVLSPEETTTQQRSAELPYTTKDMELTWPDGETRKVTVTGQQAKDIAEGRPVPVIGWPGSAAGGAAMPADDRPRGGATVYPPGHAEATTVLLKERRPKAEAAVQSLQFNETAKRLLDAGIISGYGAGLRLDAAKAKSLLGWDDARIANTEAFLATQTRQVASALASGAFGSGSSITEEDRRQAANMVGQNAALDEKSLRFLVNLNSTAANWEIDRYSKDVERHDPKGRLPILRVDRPPTQEAKPNQPTPVGSAKIGDKPYTKWSDGKWRPVGELPGEEK